MLAEWKNMQITEETLSDQNSGKISTAMGSGFLDEMTRQFPEWNVARCVNQTNTEALYSIRHGYVTEPKSGRKKIGALRL
ncbi:MAG: hypothetical protein LBK66_10960 [Spirochaetaceae bacterium]|jgi:hypothetical protein|nr:hypothetical protein [Spirochaetaceae bacterium]